MSTTPNAISAGANGAPDAGVSDAEISGSLPLVEEPVQDTPTEPEVEETPKAGTDQEATPGQQPTEDGRKIPKWMRALKDSDPEAFKRAKTDLFDLTERRALHPTVQAAREEHEYLQSMGGKDGIAKLREDGTFFKTAANQFLKGDPAFVKDLWSEDAVAAAQHVPHMLEAYKASDLDGYRSTVARLWDNEFEQVGLAKGLAALQTAIEAGDKEAALAWATSIQKWQNTISGVAKRAEDPRVKALLAERAARIEGESEAQHAEFLKSYRTDTVNAVVEDGGKVFDSFFKDRKLDPDDRTDLLRDAFRLANLAVEKDAEFMKQRDSHLESGDAQAARRLTQARFSREMPDAVKRIARRYGLTAGPAKPNVPQTNGQPQQPKGVAPQGYVAINQRPQPEEIDRSRTSNDDIISGKAVLRNGRKVSWAHLKRAS